ncbi:hypothetical protein D3C73_1335750 [compost metagenome]
MSGEFELDPGRMGLGFIDAGDIPSMHQELLKLKQTLVDDGVPSSSEEEEELDMEELIEAYEELVSLYSEANEAKQGLLMTF